MGVQTPNIDRIGREGVRLTSFYAQPSCTAGRAAFITGQLPVRTGLTTVGTPGAPAGLQKEDITLAEILKTLGYTTAQFGKNHLGDLEEHLLRHASQLFIASGTPCTRSHAPAGCGVGTGQHASQGDPHQRQHGAGTTTLASMNSTASMKRRRRSVRV
jgi:arylsulfatase A-like enzyme